jgi:hypothetical protein
MLNLSFCKSHDIDALIISFYWVYRNQFPFFFNESANDNPIFWYVLKSDVGLCAISAYANRIFFKVDLNGKLSMRLFRNFSRRNSQSDFCHCYAPISDAFFIWSYCFDELSNYDALVSISFILQMINFRMSNCCTNSNSNEKTFPRMLIHSLLMILIVYTAWIWFLDVAASLSTNVIISKDWKWQTGSFISFTSSHFKDFLNHLVLCLCEIAEKYYKKVNHRVFLQSNDLHWTNFKKTLWNRWTVWNRNYEFPLNVRHMNS